MAQPGSKISSGVSHRELPNKAYQSTRAFDTANPGAGGATSGTGTFYTYTRSLNAQYQTVGGLAKNPLCTAANCPVNRVVHANGKVLIPGVHPGGGPGVNPATGSGTTTPTTLPFPMVGVYDPVSGLNGYINPQDPTWAVYDATLSAFYDDGRSNPATTLGGQGAEPRVASAFIGSSSADNPTVVNIGAAHVGTITLAGTTATTMVVSSTDVTSSSVIMLTYGKTAGSTNAVTNAYVTAISPGANFTISFYSATSVLTAPNVGDKISFQIIN